jgi:8-oxo-dGTP pyrophosphatase MutT (NUDIX family)
MQSVPPHAQQPAGESPSSDPGPIESLAARLQGYRPRRLPGRQWVTRCGVVLLIADHGTSDDGAPGLLMMRRAERDGDPWSGHVSFPGGRVHPDDAGTRAAALRELQEETGLTPDASFVPLGRLSDLLTREHGRNRPMVITPYVYHLPCAVTLPPSLEASSLWWEPLSHLVDAGLRTTITWRFAGLPLRLPAVNVSGARLWGLSLMMVNELVRATGLKQR